MLEFIEPCIELKSNPRFKEDFIHNNMKVIHGGFKLVNLL